MRMLLFRQIIYITVSLLLGFYSYQHVTFEQLHTIFHALETISIGVFTLSGIWIAVIYPEAIAAFTNPEKLTILKGSEQAKRIENLVLIVFTSAFVLISTLIFYTASELLKNLPFVIENHKIILLFSIAFSVYLAILQIVAILSIMISNIKFVNDLYKKNAEQEANKRL
ncbi:hypothetical protein E8Q33_05285 [Methylophaga sp. SB9B]|uniref:hypothetical protein n=1 Tax=Methylophaga sp. SB9B TaxID=2570356 RepID=UPI0010A85D02|nr:hypothetical protein [Methylophaga sp. SB9B]THK42193.1 hypothetical protein E8Q33_05285 [Methylophaga sp. SB9B]